MFINRIVYNIEGFPHIQSIGLYFESNLDYRWGFARNIDVLLFVSCFEHFSDYYRLRDGMFL